MKFPAALARAVAVAALLGAAALLPPPPAAAGGWPTAGERRTSFDHGWRFAKGDPAGAAEPGFADGAWRALDLPHDWAIEGPFDPKINPHTGALPSFGVAWYRKRFTPPAEAKGRSYSIELDGVIANARVFLNGRPYGYIGFALDLTPHLVFGGENVVAVRVAPEGRPPSAVGPRPAVPLHRRQHRQAGRRRARPLRDAVRRAHDRARAGEGVPPQRPPDPLPGRVQPPRPRCPRRGGQPSRDREAARDPEAHGRERGTNEPQPAGA